MDNLGTRRTRDKNRGADEPSRSQRFERNSHPAVTSKGEVAKRPKGDISASKHLSHMRARSPKNASHVGFTKSRILHQAVKGVGRTSEQSLLLIVSPILRTPRLAL